MAAIDRWRERDWINEFVRLRAIALREARVGLRDLGVLLLDGGVWPRVAAAAGVALAVTVVGELVSPSRSSRPVALTAGPLLATAKVDRLDAYAREVTAADTVTTTATETGAFDWSSASRRIATHTVMNANGERTYGIRVAVPEGTPVRAAAEGVVDFAGDAGDGLGAKLVLNHGAVKTVYAHVSDLVARPGERVRKGQVIARSGQTGFATSPRLYLALVSSDPDIDPVAYFAGATPAKPKRCAETGCDDRKPAAKAAGPVPAPVPAPRRPAPSVVPVAAR